VRNTAKALRLGGRFLFACHHADNWRETGQVGRYAFSPERMEDVLAANGFAIEFLGVDRTVIAYDGLEQLAEGHPMLRKRWGASGRWTDFAAKVGSGPFELTWATLVGVAEFRMTKTGQRMIK